MPRSEPVRRVGYEAKGRVDRFAMRQPQSSAFLTTAALHKINDIKAPLGAPEAWQRDAYGYYEIIGEVGYVVGLTANTVAACSIRPVVRDDSIAPGGWKETDDSRVLRVWDAFVPPRGGKKELYRKAAMHLQIGGESFLLGSPLLNEFQRDAGIAWEFLSSEEVKIENNGKTIKRNYGGYGGVQYADLPPDSYIARLWRSDPRFGERPDSALKHVLPICREIVVLTQLVDAIAKSRLSAGMLFVPDEMSFGPQDEMEDDSDETDEIDPFTAELIDQLTAPVEDRTSAASLVPLVMRGPAEFYDKVKLIEVARNLDTMYVELREEALGRLAGGLDIPPEIMQGKGGLNHWTGFSIDGDFISKHVTPLGEMLAEFLTFAFLRPMLVTEEEMSEDEAANYSLTFDASRIMSRSDMSATSRAAWDREQISNTAFLRESGFDESDAPTEEEKKERDLRNIMNAEPIVFGPQILGMLYPELEGKLVLPEASMPGGDPEPNPTDVPARGNKTSPSTRPVVDGESGGGEPSPRGPAGPRMEETIINRLATGADAALERALERAGSRLLSKMNGNHTVMRDQFKSRRKQELPSLVSQQQMKSLRTTEADLLAGSWDEFSLRCRGWLQDYFTNAGCEAVVSDEKATVVAQAVVAVLESQASLAFRSPLRVGDNGLRISDELIERALKEAEKIDG